MMGSETENQRASLRDVGVRYLTPQNAHFFVGTLGSLHCIVEDQEAYANVHCLLAFPISFPQSYISVWYTDEQGREHEIGVIERLEDFPEEVQRLIRESLGRQYYEHRIRRIYDVRWEYGLLFFDVETDQGRAQFSMRWQHEKALEYGQHGKVLLDTFNNRYVIPSVQELPPSDRNKLMRFIYW
ncbi:MAG: DUF1854 domain-containing protein [candidate division KSB1 bacterium]|nr:DUF1854 domain-containing protein [candidate division KSB1 bacterium]MDZ7338490.1 DUF1854 domain-containing protein [candidate division KSB1 bacterium]MDZ7386402.1 DUF1854 domain-containing protein [candidate division KSB1 bacterium]MDZ7394035.1 DUF1854 domain-containing protein [candidate division KSB1 bacterium]MDZ7412162.1 DUF1854 domain-containing protein [candidate division KSB1 bacterium]